ncbi:hypothetical protein K490DRAFT_62129 [Saccharata proteae CBS 121410]|uniref:Uncharacterized protein n=1 Tax=Saccharata proteae CBS 121410 TaxID=1314787 RepID=A0A9P4I087_9PEZI|nr:hypothetical protein K490DRAFT_62129 [Saccharata proteae CBS 121410]
MEPSLLGDRIARCLRPGSGRSQAFCRELHQIMLVLADRNNNNDSSDSIGHEHGLALLQYFTLPSNPDISRRWTGLLLHQICLASPATVDSIAERAHDMPDILTGLGNTILSKEEDLKIVAGMIIRTFVQKGIDLACFGPIQMAAAPFPSSDTLSWTSDFQKYLDLLHVARADPESDAELFYLVSCTIDGALQLDNTSGELLMLVQNRLTFMLPAATGQVRCIDIPFPNLRELSRRKVESIPHVTDELGLTLYAKTTDGWTYLFDAENRQEEKIRVHFGNSDDASAAFDAIREHSMMERPSTREHRLRTSSAGSHRETKPSCSGSWSTNPLDVSAVKEATATGLEESQLPGSPTAVEGAPQSHYGAVIEPPLDPAGLIPQQNPQIRQQPHYRTRSKSPPDDDTAVNAGNDSNAQKVPHERGVSRDRCALSEKPTNGKLRSQLRGNKGDIPLKSITAGSKAAPNEKTIGNPTGRSKKLRGKKNAFEDDASAYPVATPSHDHGNDGSIFDLPAESPSQTKTKAKRQQEKPKEVSNAVRATRTEGASSSSKRKKAASSIVPERPSKRKKIHVSVDSEGPECENDLSYSNHKSSRATVSANAKVHVTRATAAKLRTGPMQIQDNAKPDRDQSRGRKLITTRGEKTEQPLHGSILTDPGSNTHDEEKTQANPSAPVSTFQPTLKDRQHSRTVMPQTPAKNVVVISDPEEVSPPYVPSVEAAPRQPLVDESVARKPAVVSFAPTGPRNQGVNPFRPSPIRSTPCDRSSVVKRKEREAYSNLLSELDDEEQPVTPEQPVTDPFMGERQAPGNLPESGKRTTAGQEKIAVSEAVRTPSLGRRNLPSELEDEEQFVVPERPSLGLIVRKRQAPETLPESKKHKMARTKDIMISETVKPPSPDHRHVAEYQKQYVSNTAMHEPDKRISEPDRSQSQRRRSSARVSSRGSPIPDEIPEGLAEGPLEALQAEAAENVDYEALLDVEGKPNIQSPDRMPPIDEEITYPATVLSSNSKKAPESPFADSTAISGHINEGILAQAQLVFPPSHATRNPFAEQPRKIPGTPFARRIQQKPTRQMVPQIGQPLKPAHMSEPARGSSKPASSVHKMAVHFQESSDSSSSSDIAEPEYTEEQTEEMEWEDSLRPYQRDFVELLSHISRRLVRHLIDSESAIDDVIADYEQAGTSIVERMEAKQLDEYSTHSATLLQATQSAGAQYKRLQQQLQAQARDVAAGSDAGAWNAHTAATSKGIRRLERMLQAVG